MKRFNMIAAALVCMFTATAANADPIEHMEKATEFFTAAVDNTPSNSDKCSDALAVDLGTVVMMADTMTTPGKGGISTYAGVAKSKVFIVKRLCKGAMSDADYSKLTSTLDAGMSELEAGYKEVFGE